jgi:hypothetical protein
MTSIFSQTRGFFVGVISGHISVDALDGTYLGVSLINLLGHLPMLGVTSAIDFLGMKALADPSSQRDVRLLLRQLSNIFKTKQQSLNLFSSKLI